MPPVKQLHAAGVTIFAGSDNIRDAWAPYGNGDMLERAMLIGYRQGLLADADIALAFDMATRHAAKALGVTTYGIAEGQPADLVLIPAGSTAEAVATRPARRMVMKAGLVVAANGVLVGR
jgi:cytosine/adenosine deaminase-related metal-dependent hydrolase